MVIKILEPVSSKNPVYLGPSDECLYSRVLKEHNGRTLAEIKEDGYRVQVHKKGSTIKAFTRSKKRILLELFPELSSSLENLPDCILDCELTGDRLVGHKGFKAVVKRFRHRMSAQGLQKYLESDLTSQFPISLKVFDTLFWEGHPLVEEPLTKRRIITERISEKRIIPSTQRIISDASEVYEWFECLVKKKHEGLVCKKPDSVYIPNSRDSDWIKLKRTETLDLTVLGVYMENGEISQLLCGPYNPNQDCYETVVKVNAKREGLNHKIQKALKRRLRKTVPKNVLLNQVIGSKGHMPSYFITPQRSIVVEVAAMNFQRGKNWHSCGLENDEAYSLRIGWLKSVRDDKNPEQSTTTTQIALHYKLEQDA